MNAVSKVIASVSFSFVKLKSIEEIMLKSWKTMCFTYERAKARLQIKVRDN